MKMKSRVRIFVSIYLLGFIIGTVLVESILPGLMFIFAIFWFLLFAISQYYVLKCPNCGEFACKHNFKGITYYAPYAKDKCNKCDTPY